MIKLKLWLARNEAPSYMFPEIEECQCMEFTNRDIDKEMTDLVSKLKSLKIHED